MSGFVGARARKRRRNIFLFLSLLIVVAIISYFFPSFQTRNFGIVPDDEIIPNPINDLNSLASDIEELELNLFNKDQKIKFRDGQIKNLKTEIKDTKSKYENAILELT